MSRWYPFQATNQPLTCLWCGRKLRRYPYRNGTKAHEYVNGKYTEIIRTDSPGMEWGDYGDNMFCGQRCGYQFAVDAATNGYRFKPKEVKGNDDPKTGNRAPS